MKRAEEQRVIRKAAAGDRDAAEALIRAHQKSVYAYLLRMSGRPDIAEDIAQEAFVRVLTNLHRFDPRYRFSTWLFTIARRLYVNAAQKFKPTFDTDIVDGWRSGDERPERPVEDREVGEVTRQELERALLSLSPQQREVLILFHQLEWPIALIATHVGMPEGTVKSHLHRGRRKMRTLLRNRPALCELIGEEAY